MTRLQQSKERERERLGKYTALVNGAFLSHDRRCSRSKSDTYMTKRSRRIRGIAGIAFSQLTRGRATRHLHNTSRRAINLASSALGISYSAEYSPNNVRIRYHLTRKRFCQHQFRPCILSRPHIILCIKFRGTKRYTKIPHDPLIRDSEVQKTSS